MTKNKLTDLNNHLFEQLERLQDDELDFDKEVERSKSIVSISKSIIDNAKTILDAQKHMDEYGYNRKENNFPKLLE